jgi:hypothetical protein
MTDIITGIYNAVDPFKPLEPGDPAYVDCEAERGDANVILDLGPEILRSARYTCQLYAGHRGAGKSTELLRLKADLEAKGCFVVYFAAVGEDGDIDPQDVQYTDILLACARHLLESLKQADPTPLVNWFRVGKSPHRHPGQGAERLYCRWPAQTATGQNPTGGDGRQPGSHCADLR